jgi:hypothetical protein
MLCRLHSSRVRYRLAGREDGRAVLLEKAKSGRVWAEVDARALGGQVWVERAVVLGVVGGRRGGALGWGVEWHGEWRCL